MPKIIIHKIEDLSMQISSDHLEYCKTADDLRNALKLSHLPPPTVALYSDQMNDVDQMASNRRIDHRFIIKNTAEITTLTKVAGDKITIVNNKKELMRYLYMKNMRCLIIDALKHKQAGDMGLANRSFKEAKKSLRCA